MSAGSESGRSAGGRVSVGSEAELRSLGVEMFVFVTVVVEAGEEEEGRDEVVVGVLSCSGSAMVGSVNEVLAPFPPSIDGMEMARV